VVPIGETGDMVWGEGPREKLMEWRGGDSGLTFALLARLTMLGVLIFVLPFPFRAGGGLTTRAGGLNARAGGLSARAASGLTVRIVLLKGFG
jgi:hypothetical protein